MANVQQAQRSQVLSRNHRDTKRSLEPNQENCQVNQTQNKTIRKIEAATLRGKKVRDVYTKVYDVRNTVFSYQTGQFPTRSKRGNNYIMVMVEIYNNAILVEPIKNRIDAELTRSYHTMMLRLKQAGTIPQKHILDNEVSNAMKTIICDEYMMKL